MFRYWLLVLILFTHIAVAFKLFVLHGLKRHAPFVLMAKKPKVSGFQGFGKSLPVSLDAGLDGRGTIPPELQQCSSLLQQDYSPRVDEKIFAFLSNFNFKSVDVNSLALFVEELSYGAFIKMNVNDAYQPVYYRMFEALFSPPSLSKHQFTLFVKSLYRARFKLLKTDNIDQFLMHLRRILPQIYDDSEFPGFLVFYASLGIQHDWLPRDVQSMLLDKLCVCARWMQPRPTSRVLLYMSRLGLPHSERITEAGILMALKALRSVIDEHEIDSDQLDSDLLLDQVLDTMKGLVLLGLRRDSMEIKLHDYILRATKQVWDRLDPSTFVVMIEALGRLGFSFSALPQEMQEAIFFNIKRFESDMSTRRLQRLLEGLSGLGVAFDDLPETLQRRIDALHDTLNMN